MCEIIAVTNQKGGVGKTTTAHNLIVGLVQRGYRVLGIDADPQCNLSTGLRYDRDFAGLYDLLINKNKNFCGIDDICCHIQDTYLGCGLISGSILLSAADMELCGSHRNFLLQEALREIKHQYDYIIIDTPPQLGVLVVNAYTAADKLVVPVVVDTYSMDGFKQLYNLYLDVRKQYNSELTIDGLLLTRYTANRTLSKQVRENVGMIASQLGIKLYGTAIRESIAVSEAQHKRQSVLEYAAKSNSAVDYLRFIDELIRGERLE